jgi:uncharacterized protein (DUF2236 family)
MLSIIRLPGGIQRQLDAAARALLDPGRSRTVDFTRPSREEALVSADSISWRIFKNPVALWVGGIAAVILELAEPAVRTGVWEHSSFRKAPIGRLQRTGLAAMVTVYGARSVAEPMIAAVARRHAAVVGETPAGVRYSATDPQLLAWVHATAAFSFADAYNRYVEPLDQTSFDTLYREGVPASRLYGATDAPRSVAEVTALFESMRNRLERSPIVFEFLQIMRETSAFPRALRWMQPVLVRAAVEIIPDWIRQRLGLSEHYGLGFRERWMVKFAGSLADRIIVTASPAVQSCIRLDLPRNYLYT